MEISATAGGPILEGMVAECYAPKMQTLDRLELAFDLSKGIIVSAKGAPARVVSYGAAAAVAFVGAAVGYGAYQGGKKLYQRTRGILASRRSQ